MRLIRLWFSIWLFAFGTNLCAQETSIDLRKDGRVMTAERNTYFRGCLAGLYSQTKLCQLLQGLSQEVRDRLQAMDLIAVVVPEVKIGQKFVIGLVIGSSTLPLDFLVNENDFKILRSYSRKLDKIDEKCGQIKQSNGDSARTKIKTDELRAIIAESGEESVFNSLYAGFWLAQEAEQSDKAPFADLVVAYRKEVERRIDLFVPLSIKQNGTSWATPLKFGPAQDYLKLSDLQGDQVTMERGARDEAGYLKVWHGRSLVVVAEKPGVPFDPKRYKGGLVEYLAENNSSLRPTLAVQTATFDRLGISEALVSAIATLEGQVQKTPDLFLNPSVRLQTDFLNNQTKEAATQVVSTLYQHKQILPETTLEQAALLAFASEDYQSATGFVDTGLRASGGNSQLFAARGLIQYGQSLYPQALTSFQQAKSPPTRPPADSGYEAALLGNEGLVQWGLGQTANAERSLSSASHLSSGREAIQQQIYFLLTQADLHADYGKSAKALDLGEQAIRLLSTSSPDKQSRVMLGRVHRLRAKVAFFRGINAEARQEIERAISIHQSESSTMDLARDKDLQSDIKEQQTGMQQEALKSLEQAATLYKDANYIKGQSENQLKRASVLVGLNRFDEADTLINDASNAFSQLNYRRGLGEAETLRGVLILKRAGHKNLQDFHQEMTPREKQVASEEFQNQISPGVAHFETAIRIFREIGYKRGIAYAQDKLAINLVSLEAEPSEKMLQRAESNSNEAVRTFDDIADKRGQSVAYGNLGIVLRKKKQYDDAIRSLERALQICKEIDFKIGIAKQLFNLGRAYYERELSHQDLLTAKQYFLEAQKAFKQTQAGEDELSAIEEYLKTLPQ